MLTITNYERFDGIIPTTTIINTSGDLVALNNYTCFGTGVIGCVLSHVNIVQIAKERNYDSIIILEDDALFQPDFEERIRELHPSFSELEE